MGVNDDRRLFVNVVGRLYGSGEEEVLRAMGFQRHCLSGVCYLAESGRYRVQGDLVASVGLHSTEESLALDVARRLEGAWGRHVARFAASALARWLTRRGYSVAFTRFRNILLPGLRITASTGDRVGRLLRGAAAYLAGVAEATGAQCGGVEVFMEEPDDFGVVGSARAAAGCVEIAARNSREGLVLYVGVRPGVKALYNSVLESLDGAVYGMTSDFALSLVLAVGYLEEYKGYATYRELSFFTGRSESYLRKYVAFSPDLFRREGRPAAVRLTEEGRALFQDLVRRLSQVCGPGGLNEHLEYLRRLVGTRLEVGGVSVSITKRVLYRGRGIRRRLSTPRG